MAYLIAIEMFGLQGVSHVGDLTNLQLQFIAAAWWRREELRTPDVE